MTDTITLGGKTFEIKPITLGVMRRIGVANAKILRKTDDPSKTEDFWYEGTFDMIEAATGEANISRTLVGVSLDELVAAREKICEVSGLRKPQPKADGDPTAIADGGDKKAPVEGEATGTTG